MNKKFKNHHRVWFINFGGIGNGAMIMPILKCFENSKPSVEYYCTENDLFSVKWFLKEAKIKNLIGLTTSKWRRFNKENWTEIL